MKKIFKVLWIIAIVAVIGFSISCGGGDDNGGGNTGVSVTGVTLNKTTLTLTVGGTETLTATVNPTNATNKTVAWSTSNAAVANVNSTSGLVTAVAAGTATITVTTADGNKTATCSVTVPVSVTGVSLNKSSLFLLAVGDSETLTATVAPDNATNKAVTWTTSDATKATVVDGLVTAVAVGTATITVTTADGNKTATCAVTVGFEMVSIPAGTFTMGSPTSESGRYSDETQHPVTLNGFYMGKYQVTQEQYQAVMGTNPSSFSSSPQAGEIQGKRPVERVSWYDTLVFCNKLSVMEGLSPAYRINGSTDPAVWETAPTSDNATWNAVEIVAGSTGYRLPTEAQWEYACRAGTTTAYNTGNTISDNTGWYSSNSGSKTHEVGKKPANAWGLYDMHGNVYEWCWDWYGYYSSSAQTDPLGASSGTDRVRRGGSWFPSAEFLRSAARDGDYPGVRGYDLGFRLVRP